VNKLTKGALVTAALLGGSVATGGQAFASAAADGAAVQSPGVLSGNSVQVPVHVPVNLCGNTVNIIAALNPAIGNTCANAEGSERPGHPEHPTPAPHHIPGHTPGHIPGQTPGHIPGHTPDADCPPEQAPQEA
jgi:hypothetical protein